VGTDRLEHGGTTAEPPRRHHGGVAESSLQLPIAALRIARYADILFVPFCSSCIVRPSPLKNPRRSSRKAERCFPCTPLPPPVVFATTLLADALLMRLDRRARHANIFPPRRIMPLAKIFLRLKYRLHIHTRSAYSEGDYFLL